MSSHSIVDIVRDKGRKICHIESAIITSSLSSGTYASAIANDLFKDSFNIRCQNQKLNFDRWRSGHLYCWTQNKHNLGTGSPCWSLRSRNNDPVVSMRALPSFPQPFTHSWQLCTPPFLVYFPEDGNLRY